ncbi:MAG: hypothetical protein KAS32_12285 [Candidatus Peribacteraceae bacterium]|nr:hypothetical protein [Candidatus Peribacteraceae bacterium]
MNSKKCKVYIASPYTVGDAGTNVKKQLDCFSLLLDMGLIPFAPLTSHFLHIANPKTYRQWMDWDFEWVRSCDCLIRLPGQSSGGDEEMGVASDHCIPVFTSIHDFVDWISQTDYEFSTDKMSVIDMLEEFDRIVKVDSTLHI